MVYVVTVDIADVVVLDVDYVDIVVFVVDFCLWKEQEVSVIICNFSCWEFIAGYLISVTLKIAFGPELYLDS